MNAMYDNLQACVKMQGSMTANLLTPGMTAEVLPGRAAVAHEECKLVSLWRFADAPYRKAERVVLDTLEALVDYVQFRGAEGVVVMVGSCCAAAIFNAATWGDDCAEFDLEYTREVKDWTRCNEVWMSQEDFCDFLEDQQGVIKEPCGVELLDLVANFRQKSSVEFGRSFRGSDGQVCVSYQEKTTGATRDMALPSEFTLHLPIIRGAEKMTTYEVKARLKVRIDKDTHNLKLKYSLVRLDVPQRNAVADVAGWLRGKLEGCRVFEGRVCVSNANRLASLTE